MQLNGLFGKVSAARRALPRLVLVLVGVSFSTGISLGTGARADTVDVDYQKLIGQLVNDQASSVDLIHIPYSTIFTVRVTPAEIRKWTSYSCHVEITPETSKSLLGAVKDAHALSIDGVWDIRWMLQINMKGGVPPTALYLNGRSFVGAGQRGYLNDQPIAITGSLSRWMERIYNETCPDLHI